MIQISSLSKRFGRFRALEDVSLSIAPGQSVALWGPNGAGKSTLIRCVLGLIRFSGGIRVAGIDVRRNGKAARSLIGYVPQELGFYDDLRVDDALALFARLKGLSRSATSQTLAEVSLDGHERKRIRELSGGMKQRLALAVALLGQPPVLVLDEVTASLDALGREEFVRLLAGLRQGGRTMLFASHRTDEIAALASRVIVMSRGRVEREAAPAELCDATHTGSVKIHLDHQHHAHALSVLRTAGFAPALNGVGVIVPVDPARKAVPVRLLCEACIPVENFELLSLPSLSAPATGGAA